jgi:hypothetical protein
MNGSDRDLGMNRRISRRDFLNGAAVALTSSIAPGWLDAWGLSAEPQSPETAPGYNTLFDPVDWALSTPDDRAHVVGRRQFGRISIANADAAGSSHTDAAIDMAYRAVNEIIAAG